MEMDMLTTTFLLRFVRTKRNVTTVYESSIGLSEVRTIKSMRADLRLKDMNLSLITFSASIRFENREDISVRNV